MRRSSHQSKTFLAKRRTRQVTFSALVILLVGLGIWGLSALWSMGALTISQVSVSGVDESSSSSIQAAALSSLQGSYLGLFSRSNTLTYPHDTIIETVTTLHPEVETITAERVGRHAIAIDILEKEPAALICLTLPDFDGNELTLEDPGSCYFADEDGFIFKKSPSFSGTLYSRYYVPDLSDEAVIGRQATSTSEFSFLQDVYTTLEATGIAVQAILMKVGGEYEIYARNPGSESSTVVIYLNTVTLPEEQLANLTAFWNHSVETARTTKRSLEFDSIDVRYAPNVYSTRRTSSI